jgi:magnesium chelatase subunit I
VKKNFKNTSEKESGLLMEFVLYGLAAYSMISKKMLDGQIQFKDLMGSMIDLGKTGAGSEEDYDGEDFT